MEKVYYYLEIATDKIVFYIPKLLLGALVLWIGLKIIKKIYEYSKTGLTKAGFTETVIPFVLSLINISLKTGLFLLVATILGANLTGFIAILAAIGFAIGMALQGSLGNFASGLLILTLKPYGVNDWVKIDEHYGKVVEIGLFTTKIITIEENTLIIPNSHITENILTNYSEIGTRRLSVFIPIPYNEDYPRVEKLIRTGLKEIPEILPDPKPIIEIDKFDTHNILIAVRPYTTPDNYWDAVRKTYAVIKHIFHENDIKIAYIEGYQLGEIGA